MCVSILKVGSNVAQMFLTDGELQIVASPTSTFYSVTLFTFSGVPNMMNSVLESFSIKKFVSIPSLMSSMHAPNCPLALFGVEADIQLSVICIEVNLYVVPSL